MNINLRDVVCTSKDGEKFTKLTECYIRGSSIKYLRLPEEAVDRVLEEEKQWQGSGGRGRGGKCVFCIKVCYIYLENTATRKTFNSLTSYTLLLNDSLSKRTRQRERRWKRRKRTGW